jgi:hypothetical protein
MKQDIVSGFHIRPIQLRATLWREDLITLIERLLHTNRALAISTLL